jgi:hypothetical protein
MNGLTLPCANRCHATGLSNGPNRTPRALRVKMKKVQKQGNRAETRTDML